MNPKAYRLISLFFFGLTSLSADFNGWAHLELGAGNYGPDGHTQASQKKTVLMKIKNVSNEKNYIDHLEEYGRADYKPEQQYGVLFWTLDQLVDLYGPVGIFHINDLYEEYALFAAAKLIDYAEAKGYDSVIIEALPGDYRKIDPEETLAKYGKSQYSSAHLKNPEVSFFHDRMEGDLFSASEEARQETRHMLKHLASLSEEGLYLFILNFETFIPREEKNDWMEPGIFYHPTTKWEPVPYIFPEGEIIGKEFSLVFHISSSPLTEMSPEEKVGQLLMVHFNGEQANEAAQTLIQKLNVGGIIYYEWANSLHSPEQVAHLSEGLQHLASQNRIAIPLLIAIDQEGGRVARLTKGFFPLPSQEELAKSGDPELALEDAFKVGEELTAVGINMNLAPVVDINSNPNNRLIGNRSFGDSPDLVIAFGEKMIQGYHQAGIITSLKHFPGHGDVKIDSHEDLPLLSKSKEELRQAELAPFFALASQADTIMTAHIVVPAIDPDSCATLSKKVLDIIRNEIGFQGVIISDSLIMDGLLKNTTSIDAAAIAAFNAGCDILLLGGKQLVGTRRGFELTLQDVERIHQALVDSVKSGLISEERLDEAVQRILALKERYLQVKI